MLFFYWCWWWNVVGGGMVFWCWWWNVVLLFAFQNVVSALQIALQNSISALQNSISALQNGYKSDPGGKWLSRIHSQRLKTRRVCNGACFGLKRLRAALRALYRHE